MFNSTHTFVGFAFARTGVEKWVPYATATAVIASNLPDIDSVAGFWGTAAYLDHHRGITHSLVGVPIFAFLLAAVMYLFSGKFWRTYTVALIAMATHPALDFLNSYGLRPFLPWNGRWYYGDILFIFDPYIDTALLLGIFWGSWRPSQRRLGAFLSLLLAMLYIGARIQLHTMAASNAEEFAGQAREAKNWAVLPQMLNPLIWEVINETNSGLVRFNVDATGRAVTPAGRFTQMHSSPSSEAITEAARARSAAVLMRFARFPVVEVDQLPSGYRVTFFDFRFYREASSTALGSEVILDQVHRVVSEDLSFVQRIE